MNVSFEQYRPYIDSQNLSLRSKEVYSKENMTRNYLNEYDRDGKKQRILLIDVNCKFSSTGKIVYDLFSYLKSQGRDACICYGRGQLVKEKGIYKFGLDWETRIHAGLARLTGYNGCFSFFSTKRLIKYIKKFNPEIIHIHELHAYFVNIKMLLTYIKKNDIKLISTFHCEYMYTGKCGHAYSCEKYRSGCGKCPAVHDYPKSLFFDRTRQMFLMKKNLLKDLNMTIITPSKWLADRVKTSFLKDKNISVIHNGVDTKIFHPVNADSLRAELNIPFENKVLLALAPDIMSIQKGGQWVLRLAEMSKKQAISFILVGCENKNIQAPNNCIILGVEKDIEKLPQFYSLADVFLLFSERETYSMTCAEALCCGTPVVGFKCGAPETVFTKTGAKFFEYGDIDSVKNYIDMILNKGNTGIKK